MQINITQFFTSEDPSMYAASAMELGQDAGRITWQNAKDQADSQALLNTEEELQAMRDWARSSGGWDADEIATWDAQELNALFIQLISGDMREIENLASDAAGNPDWKAYEELASEGTLNGSIFKGTDGNIYYYLGD